MTRDVQNITKSIFLSFLQSRSPLNVHIDFRNLVCRYFIDYEKLLTSVFNPVDSRSYIRNNSR